MQSDDIKYRNRGITSCVDFEEATALVAEHFAVEIVDQFEQGLIDWWCFRGVLQDTFVAIGVQGGHELATVSRSTAAASDVLKRGNRIAHRK